MKKRIMANDVLESSQRDGAIQYAIDFAQKIVVNNFKHKISHVYMYDSAHIPLKFEGLKLLYVNQLIIDAIRQEFDTPYEYYLQHALQDDILITAKFIDNWRSVLNDWEERIKQYRSDDLASMMLVKSNSVQTLDQLFNQDTNREFETAYKFLSK